MFNVVTPVPGSSTTQTGIIGGTFTPSAIGVNVSLFVNERGRMRSSTQFSIPHDALWRLRIKTEIPNLKKFWEREYLLNPLSLPVEKPVRIQAWFNSDSMTFLHREPLGITLMADSDCYFKIILIDANNLEQVIYPFNNEDNFLSANTPREVFKNSQYMLYGPYGVATIVVIASTKQFDNIGQEYSVPPHSVSVASLSNAIADNSAARYDLAILEPQTEYVFVLPFDMSSEVKNLESGIKSQSGLFEGDETSGYFIIKGIRNSYRVIPQGNPVSIEYVIYDDGIWDGVAAAFNRLLPQPMPASLPRPSSPVLHSFSLEKPRNLALALETVKKGILDIKDGVFEGDLNSGIFRAPTLTGPLGARYKVTDMIDIDIIERPFGASNKLIEDEVKKRFQAVK
jgi:hypothetical protein